MSRYGCYIVIFLMMSGYALGQPTILVDVDTDTPGVQSMLYLDGTEQQIIVDFIVENFENVVSYEFAMAFDSSKLTFVEGDHGTLGNRNILKSNGGNIIGLVQPQQNPLANDTITYQFSITSATPEQAVSGTGLLGYAVFTPKLAEGDTCAIVVSRGGWVVHNGSLTPFTAFSPAYCVNSNTGISDIESSVPEVLHCYATSGITSGTLPTLHFTVPESFKGTSQYSITLFDMKGQLIAVVGKGEMSSGTYSVDLEDKVGRHVSSSGLYLCNIEIENISRTIKIWHD